ncbi:hypothetical protein PUN28_006746 [Cardiocondyla obscurior]|uniref:Histidine decarboxylase n=1 Tax=Cardiocondyla obscurior TaxID=286306 RepID=A0AAW2G5V8_9HYME
MVDYIADYLENIRSRRVYPAVSPGYLRNVLPASAPVDGEPWEDIFTDIEKCIMPGVTHWQSPHMHAYFPALNSPASLLGDMLADAINCLGFTWASSPACTELETIVMNWLGKMIGLPEDFLHRPGGSGGGGVIQTTASEATLVCLLAARTRAIRAVQENDPNCLATEINSRLVAYCSDQAHSSVEKAGLIGLVRMRYIESDSELSMRGDGLLEALKRDRAEGLLPFFHWQIPLSKRFRALKLWFVIRNYGITGLQKHIREGVRLAQKFEALVLADSRFEIPAARHLGMVVFRLRGENTLTERLLKKLNSRGRLHCVPAALHGKYVIRFTVTSTNTTNEDILKDWAEIRSTANEILDTTRSPRARVPLAAIRRRIRGILMSGKQFSLDSRMDLVQDSDNSETIKKGSSVSKSGSSYAVVNGSLVNVNDEDNDDSTVTIVAANVGFPRSETIAAIGHRPYTGDLPPVRVSKKLMKENEEDDDKRKLCRKCGHYSKQQ